MNIVIIQEGYMHVLPHNQDGKQSRWLLHIGYLECIRLCIQSYFRNHKQAWDQAGGA